VADLRVDLGRQCVLRGQTDIALPNLSFRLLVALIEFAPNVISNERLMEMVWPGQVVSPETVNKRVKLLRDALGDHVREPRYIAGVRSRGYRLIAPVHAAPREEIASSAAQDHSLDATKSTGGRSENPLPPATPAISRHGRWLRRSVAAMAIAVTTAFAVWWNIIDHPALREPKSIPDKKIAVAVMPFENLSAESADAYLALGVPEMIISRMSQSQVLSVIARGSSFALASKSLSSREIGRRLNAAFLVGGSIQRDADRLRLDVQLTDAVANTVVWSARFDRKLHDIFEIEDEIGDQVDDALVVRTGAARPKSLAKERSGNVEAYLAFLRGRTLLGRFTVPESEAAIPYFEKAIGLDPQFAPAYASLYDARMQAADGRGEDVAPLRERYRALIDRSLAIDPQCGAAYFARAMWSNDEPHLRDADFRRGAEFDPSNGRGLTAYADFLKWGYPGADPGDSARVLQRALQIDPMAPLPQFKAAVWSSEEATSKTQVVEQKVLEVLEKDPNFVPALSRYGKYRWLFDGKIAEGIQFEEHAIAQDPTNPWIRYIAMAMYLDIGDETAARDVAAGTPKSAQTARLMLALHAGDWRAAGLAAFDKTVWEYNEDVDWGAPDALRDFAIKSHELDRTIQFMRDKYNLRGEISGKLSLDNFRAAVFLSQLLAASGQGQAALDMRRAAAAWNDANQGKLGTVYAIRLRATIAMLDGKQDAALTELADSFKTADYENWWYTLVLDPLWMPLHEDPRFRAVSTEVQRYIALQREELEAMRRDDEVPRRGAPQSAR
jgi:TolB-like protein/DNA-binding winged helix-turn-helix (wHTH) protein/tetratricopeptide (TPR) repeat protein